MPERGPERTGWPTAVAFTAALAFVLFMNGAVPFLATPTTLQALWTSGFSQSFASQGFFAIHATHFGAPDPAPIMFGLAGAWPAGVFIAAGLHPADGYAAMVALWLSIGFWAAWRLATSAGARPLLAVLGATVWMGLPVVWMHAGFSMLSLGIALLPFYFWTALRLFDALPAAPGRPAAVAATYVAACVIAVFMDGYTFVMFAVGASLLGAWAFLREPGSRRRLLLFAFPVHVVGFALAYALYVAYIGRSDFAGDDLDFFRGWGLDLAFVAIPTRGIHWLWDLLGLSAARGQLDYFGDLSVSLTTFSLPLVVAGLLAWWLCRSGMRLANVVLLIALFGWYMSLGPTLKVNAARPPDMRTPAHSSMPAQFGIAPTGSGLISRHVPGFRNMRAAYRWSALGMFGFWFLVMLMVARMQSRHPAWAAAVLAALIVAHLPHLLVNWKAHRSFRDTFMRIDTELVAELVGVLRPGDKVAFMPWRNDFLVNYIAPRIGIRAYNTGGDKNVRAARAKWPHVMRETHAGHFDENLADRVALMLASRKMDAVVLPYIDTLAAAQSWPAPPVHKDELAATVAALRNTNGVSVEEGPHFAVVRMESASAPFEYPIVPARPSVSLYRALGRGWHDIEPGHVWSGRNAELELPIPESCTREPCRALIVFQAYGAPDRSVTVDLRVPDGALAARAEVPTLATSAISVPLPARRGTLALSIEVPAATSPRSAQGANDDRVLGIALHSIELAR